MRSLRAHPLLLGALDTAAVFVVFNVIAWMRGLHAWPAVIGWALLAPLGFLAAALYLIDGYRSRTAMMSLDYTSQHLLAVVAALVGTLLLTFVIVPDGFPLQSSRSVIALSFLVLVPLTLSYRRSTHRWITTGRQERSVLFLGDRNSCEEFRRACGRNGLNQRILCAATDGEAPGPDAAAPGSCGYEEIMNDVQARRVAVEAIVLQESTARLPDAVAERLVELYFNGVPTYTLELFYETYWRKIPLYRINHVWLFQEGFHIARNPVFERGKRWLDVLMAAVGLVLFSPLLGAAAVGIWAQDRGPVFFRQVRIGRNRQPFRLLKLRTMRMASEAEPGRLYTEANDPRITRLGRLLRATRLDEVPQLWNVLKGEMSLIGPRPEWIRLVEGYEREIPCYHFRHLVRPGITGWAQVNYPYGANLDDTLRKLEYDLFYIRHFSFLIDASIILKTVHLMLFGKGR